MCGNSCQGTDKNYIALKVALYFNHIKYMFIFKLGEISMTHELSN